jgi:transaldolase
MKFFLDTANVEEISEMISTGLVDGVTTNPSLIAASGRNIIEVISEICDIVDGPVSAEVTATDFETMLAEGRLLRKIASNIAVKVPLTFDGLKTCKTLSDEGTPVNVTLCFSAAQALLAAKAGAAFISPFAGRVVLVASVRGPQHVTQAALLGADIATLPSSVIKAMYKHPLTETGLKAFLADWEKTGQSILGSNK